MTFNNIKVDNSVIGAINTGTIHRLDVQIGEINQGGNTALSKALKEFTESVTADNAIAAGKKDELLEQVAFLVAEMNNKGPKQPSVLRSVLGSVKDVVATSSGLLALWQKLEPLLAQGLNLVI